MKSKIIYALCLTVIMCLTTGCSSGSSRERFKDRLNEAFRQQSGINDDSEYISYKADLSAGRLVNGHYSDTNTPVDPDAVTREQGYGKAGVSFAQNSMLNVHYYLDEEHTNEIKDPYKEIIYLEAGQSLYATAEKKTGSSPEKYAFSAFRVYKTENGRKTLVSESYDSRTGLFFTVPDGCDGLELSVEPVGKYSKNRITLSDYYTDDTFKHISAEGTWTVGGKEFSAGEAESEPFGMYTVKYEFDPEKYFFVSSEPKYTFQDEKSVTFGRASASDDISDYSVELHPYITSKLKAPDSNAKATVNGEAAGSFTKGQEIVLEHLKFGDTIVINCSKKDILQYDDTVLSLEKSDDTFASYTFTVKEQSEDFTFDPEDYTFEHGEVTFTYLGKPVTGKIGLAAGRKIEYSEKSADEGYWLPTGNNVITISDDPEENQKQFEKICFYEKKLVTLTLPQPSAGGTVTYKKGEDTLTGKAQKIYAGTEIKLILKPWQGWESTAETDTFIVSDESEEQTVTAGGVQIKEIFKEVKEHRPHLKVIADKLVGTDMQFTVRTSDISENELSRDIKNNVLLDTTTGTADGIYISADNGKIAKSQIIKLQIDKTDSNGNKVTDIIYLNELASEKKIDIYPQNETRSSDVFFKDITITIYIAFRQTYQPRTYENATLSLQYADTSDHQAVQTGDILDRDRLVTVIFKPAEGFYIIGEHVTDNVYRSEMKYSDYLQTAEKIGRNYPRKKIYTVDLNTSDKYGKVTYTLNGKKVSGKTQVREDDKLVMDYVIENKDYIIYKDFISAMYDLLSKSPYERSETITVTEELDGSVISREDFIEVQKKEK